MPLEVTRAEKILSDMRALSVETRLKAIEDAREMFKNSFKENSSDSEYSYSAYVIESLYNLIREELRVTQIRIKTPDSVAKTPKAKAEKAKKPEKAKPPVMDMATLLANFAKYKQGSTEEK